jgi:hypothetical protein
MVADRGNVLHTAIAAGLDLVQAESLLGGLERWESKDRLNWVERVVLESDRISVAIRLPGTSALRIELAVPMQLRRRGRERRLIIPTTSPSEAKQDGRLIQAIRHGHLFWRRLLAEPKLTAVDIGQQKGLDNRYIGRTLPLAFLAPDLVERFLSGRQPPEWTAERVLRLPTLPASWAEQRKLFGSS